MDVERIFLPDILVLFPVYKDLIFREVLTIAVGHILCFFQHSLNSRSHLSLADTEFIKQFIPAITFIDRTFQDQLCKFSAFHLSHL